MDKIVVFRWLTLSAYFPLLALILIWNTLISPSTDTPMVVVLGLQALPLLFPLRGLLHGRAYTHAWTSFLALYYFFIGVGDAWSDPEDRIYGILMVVLSVELFTSAMLYARFKGRQDKAAEDTQAQ